MNHFIEPYYLVDFNSSISNFEIYINDMPAFIHLEGGSISSHYPINHFILESGEHTIRIKILPLKGEYNLKVDSFVKVKVFYYDSSTTNYDDSVEVFSYETPDLSDLKLPVIELEAKFKAEVPYILHGWKNSSVYRATEDKDQSIAFYKKMYGYFKEENIDMLFDMQSVKFSEIDTAMYLTENNRESLGDLLKKLKDENFILQDFPSSFYTKNYGYGRVLSLIRENGNSIVYYKNKKTEEEFSFPVLIHKEVKSQSFEIIR